MYFCTKFKIITMIHQYKHDNQQIAIFADIHGEFDLLISKLKNTNNLSNSILICAGDIGVGFKNIEYYNKVFSTLNIVLCKMNSVLYCIRGNHDDPSYFSGDTINKSNVKLIKDYSVISVGDKNILCVGGAVSIDRKYRISNYQRRLDSYMLLMQSTLEDAMEHIFPSYWENELPKYDEEKLNELSENGINISFVVTHTSPSFCYKSDKNGIEYWINNDSELNDDLTYERNQLDLILNKLIEDGHMIEKWVYGHFHGHNEEEHDNIKYIALYNSDYIFDYHIL